VPTIADTVLGYELSASDRDARYVTRNQGGGVARFEVVESEAHIVRRIFAWIGLDRMSLRAVCRRSALTVELRAGQWRHPRDPSPIQCWA
jgi:hypothetical protein